MEHADAAQDLDVGAGALPLVRAVVEALASAGVSYCHWKSNEAIDRSASGDNDLDLLVARRDAAAFTAALYGLGFLLARPRASRQLPGVLDYYARDRDTGRIVHVHAHYQLVLGDDMTKSFRLPIEEAYLSSAVSDGLFPLPSPAFEYLLFVLRMAVKHAPWDAQLGRKGRLTPSERRELEYLQQRIDREVLDALVQEHLPFVGLSTFAAAERAITDRSGRLSRALAGRRVLRALRAHSRRTGLADLVLRVTRREAERLRGRLPLPAPKKRLDTGGLVIAVVGGDGAGKSSTVDFLEGLLAQDLQVARFHLGKPPWSRLTTFVKRPLQRLRARGWFATTGAPAWAEHARFPGVAFILWHLLTARDRFREYQRIRRFVARGGIAICDRFHLPGITVMDGPRTGQVPGLARRPGARWLAEREAAYYAHVLPPDLLLVLRVDPEEAVRRRPEQDAEFVRRRAGAIWAEDWERTDAVVLDAGASIEQVQAAAAAAVWALLQGREPQGVHSRVGAATAASEQERSGFTWGRI